MKTHLYYVFWNIAQQKPFYDKIEYKNKK